MIKHFVLVGVLAGYAIFTWWFITAIAQAGEQIARYQEELAKPPAVPAAIVRFDGVKQGLVIPSWKWLEPEHIWAYVSAKSSIDLNYKPELTSLTVPKTDWMYSDLIRPEVNDALEKLFEHAEQENQPLLVTSAYRSAHDQSDFYEFSLQNNGQEWVDSHIANPGQSEHQLGLTADFSSYSQACVAAFAGCQLRGDTVKWLAENAADFGFILRYPPDKAHITGIAYEPWHYRYVGKEMARVVQETGLTYDEVIEIIKKEMP